MALYFKCRISFFLAILPTENGQLLSRLLISSLLFYIFLQSGIHWSYPWRNILHE